MRSPVLLLLLGPGLALSACGVEDAAARSEAAAFLTSEAQAREQALASGPVEPREPSSAFSSAFRLRGRVRVAMADPAAARLPAACAMDGQGTVYLAGRRRPQVYRWQVGAAGVERLSFARGEAPVDPTALAWDAASATLHLLDVEGRRLLRYGADARLRDYTYLNAGHSGFSLGVLPGGDVVVGGERWVGTREATVVAVFDREGRLRRTFFPMDPEVIARNMHVLVPVALSVEEGSGEVLAAEPTSYVLRRLSPAGDELARFGVEPPGYAAPSPRPAEPPPTEDLQAWIASWTPLRFVHAAGGLAFSGFEVRRPYHGSQLDVYGRDGERLAAGLLSDAQPLCGAGTTLVFARRAGGETVELSAYEYVGPGAAARSAPHASRPVSTQEVGG